MRTWLLTTLVALQYAALATGCAGSQADSCDRNQDCPSGFCRADHTCAPADGDGGVEPDGDGTPDAEGPVGCTPDHDGILTRAELPLQPGRVATYRVALDATVSTAGTQQSSGQRAWDLGTALTGDADVTQTLLDPADQWWAASFPDASYATTLSAESDLLGVFELTDTRLRLLGVVSPTGGSLRTELAYDPPVDVLVLPMGPSASWTVDTTITGLAQGVASYYTESYESRVDAVGTLDTPYGPFPVSRVAVDLTRQVGALITTKRTFAFVAECYAQVGTIVSQDYESGSEFTDAAEVRRLAP
ncbi:MAG: hypothetical protein H6708_29695 [Kofleriaceae bacterium]|nr:hypothetical protein [Kofleriaceae bacterium]